MKNSNEFIKVIENDLLSVLDFKIKKSKKRYNDKKEFELVKKFILKQLKINKKDLLLKYVENKLD